MKLVVVSDVRRAPACPSESTYSALSTLHFKPKQKTVFIKPNVNSPSKASTGVVTDPEVVRGIIRYVRDLGIEDIVVGESVYSTAFKKTFYGKRRKRLYNESTFYNLTKSGYSRMVSEEGVRLIDLNYAERTQIPWKHGLLNVPKLAVDPDVCYVNVAKLKTHMQAGYSLCKKNQKGLLSNEQKKFFHKLGIAEPVLRLAEVVRPDLCVVDGIVGLEGQGPGEWGSPRKFGKIIAGYDIDEVDAKCVELMKKAGWRMPELFVYRSWRVTLHAPVTACSACLKSLGKLRHFAGKNRRGFYFFLKHGIFGRLDIFVGKHLGKLDDATFRGYCLFYGDCTRKLAKEYPIFPWVKGCPPDPKEALACLK